MIFQIYDGRSEFYQWDVDRKLKVLDNSVNEVHFCNRTDDCSLVCEVYEEDGERLVNVPNILLQTAWPIKAYAYCDNCYTKQCATFKVNARTKPTDYVYTETEVAQWDAVLERMDEVEEVVNKLNGREPVLFGDGILLFSFTPSLDEDGTLYL